MDLSTVPPLVLVHILITLFSIPIVNNGPIQDLIRDQLIQLHNHPETTLAQFILNCRNQVAQPPPNNSWITRELVLNNEQINWDRLDIQQHRIISLRIIFQSPAVCIRRILNTNDEPTVLFIH